MPPEPPTDRRLSSDVAVGVQTGIAIALTIATAAVGVIAWLPGLQERLTGSDWPSPVKAMPVFAIAVAALVWYQNGRMCDVYLTPHGLRIRRGSTEILVPLNQVKRVWQDPSMGRNRGDQLDRIMIEFRAPTALGASIQFSPTYRLLRIGDHPLVDELRRRAGLGATVTD